MTKEPKYLLFDIEATNLSAPFGMILCIGRKYLGQSKVYCPTVLDNHVPGTPISDKKLVADFAAIYNEADVIVTHYGKRYDVPMIDSKLLKYNLPPLSSKPHIDTWEVLKKKFKMHSNRLQAISEYIGTPNQKTPITFDDWLRAAGGDQKSIAAVVTHCKADVLVLEEVFQRVRPWITWEPARGLFVDADEESCPSCGGHLQRRGFHRARTMKYQRFQCQECGRWSRSRKGEKSNVSLISGY